MERGPERILDEYLVLVIQAGSRDAFDSLVRRWTPRLLRYASRVLGDNLADAARDVVQETWVGAVRGIQRLREPAQFRVWIYAIAERKCADELRSRLRRRRLEADACSWSGAAIDHGTGAIEALAVARGIAHLPPEQRSVVHLYYAEDLSVEEIAAVVDVPAGTVKSRLHHAREKLRHYMSGETKGERK